MKFELNSRKWDTRDLLEFDTRDPVVTIYVDEATRTVFVGIHERSVGIQVHPADDSEIEWVGGRYGLPQLLKFLSRGKSSAD